MLWQTRFRGNDKVGAINFGYGAKLVGSDGRIDSSCSIRYDWLVDGAESEITESSSFNWVPTACQFAVFDTYKESFDFILDTLGDKNPALPLVDPEVSTALVEMVRQFWKLILKFRLILLLTPLLGSLAVTSVTLSWPPRQRRLPRTASSACTPKVRSSGLLILAVTKREYLC